MLGRPLGAMAHRRRKRAVSATFGRGQVQQDAFTEGLGLFDHLGGACQEGAGHGEAERLGGLEVDDQLIFGRCLHR